MEIQVNNSRISDIQLNVELIPQEEQQKENPLRIPLDHAARRGNWTGSQFKNLMSCDNVGGKMDWFNKEKVFRFSEGAIKYIFANAMERKTGRYLTTDSTKEMKYGSKVEPLIFKRAAIELKKLGLTLEQVGFKTFPGISTAGVTSDSVVLDENKVVIASFESKACSSWTTLYDRTYELTHDKSTDFWQTQGQTFAWEVKETYYCVISPCSDINKYLYCENIMDMYDEWEAETEMHIEIIKSSPIHLECLRKRIVIAESVVDRFLSEETKMSLKEILHEEIDHYRSEWAGSEAAIGSKEVDFSLTEDEKDELARSAEIPKDLLFQPTEERLHVEPKKEIKIDMDNIPF